MIPWVASEKNELAMPGTTTPMVQDFFGLQLAGEPVGYIAHFFGDKPDLFLHAL